ncbi:MAG: hypothetical protein GVY13_19685 [Alphaproteobacteria bacterium]|jgi:hypothetical protein|nr:hypothetical protein [Alphaproteobacteria bacterium]
MKKAVSTGAAGLALAGCVETMSAVPAGPLDGDAGFTVTLQDDWTRVPASINMITRGDLLTRDGLTLNQLHLISLEDGESLVRAAKDADVPVYTAGMSALEQVDLVTASLQRLQYADVATANVRPQDFDGTEGTRFDITGKFRSGLDFRGDVAVAEAGDKMHVVVFLAPAAHYYDSDAGEVAGIIASADLAE